MDDELGVWSPGIRDPTDDIGIGLGGVGPSGLVPLMEHRPGVLGVVGLIEDETAVVVGYYVVWNVTHALHTPLMSVTNAISGIIIVGAITQLGSESWGIRIVAALTVLIASINIFGGFTVTQRMLKMFRKA